MKNKVTVGLSIALLAYIGFYYMQQNKQQEAAKGTVAGEVKADIAPQAQEVAVAAAPQAEAQKLARVTLEEGLEYEVVTASDATVVAEAGKKVTVDYTGWVNENGAAGKKFDSSLDRNQKFTFQLGAGQVIPGWEKGVANMKVGEVRRLYVPAKLAYADKTVGEIPANSNLIFEVKLHEVA